MRRYVLPPSLLPVVLGALVALAASMWVSPEPVGAQAPAVTMTPTETQPGGQVTVASPAIAGCPAGSSPFVAILGRTTDGLTLQTESLPLPARGGAWRTVLTIPDDTSPGTYAMVARCFSDADNTRPRVEYQAVNLVVRQQRLGPPLLERGTGGVLNVRSSEPCLPPTRTSPPSAGAINLRVSLTDSTGAVRDQVIAGVQSDGSWTAQLTLPVVTQPTQFLVVASCRATSNARRPYAVYNEAAVQVEGTPATTTTIPTEPTTPPTAPDPLAVVPVASLPVAQPPTPLPRQPNYTG